MTTEHARQPGRAPRLLRILLAVVIALIAVYFLGQRDDDRSSMEGFSCAGGKQGWKRAKAVTPDVVAPCYTGSVGICDTGFEYVTGTGWCRPRA